MPGDGQLPRVAVLRHCCVQERPGAGQWIRSTLPVGSVVEFHGIQTRWMGEGKLPQDRDSAGRSH